MKYLFVMVLIAIFLAGQALAQTVPPATPTLSWPPNDTVGLPRTITLSWNASANASLYHLQVATDSTFASGFRVNDSTLATATRGVGFLVNSTVYFWRVRAMNPAGASAFSDTWRFKTTLATPRLSYGPTDPSFIDTVTALTWLAVPEATWYRVQLSRDSLLHSILKDTTISPDPYLVISGLEHNKDYWWRVSANNNEVQDVWSSIWKLHTVGLGPQHGLPSETKRGLLSGNNVEAVYYNMGEFGDWQNQPTLSFVWPKGSEHPYIDGTAFIVQARAITDSGKAIHPLETNYYEYTRHNINGVTYGWWPIPGYAMSGQGKVAISDDPSTWPTHWPDKPNDWDGQWNGYLGKGVRDSLTETYFVMDDDGDREYLPHFRPDSADTARGGLGLRVSGRAMEWRWPKLQDVLFMSFSIFNESTTTYDSMYTAQYIDYSVGGHDNSGYNDASYLPSEQLFIARCTAPYGLPGNWSPVGLVGVLGLATPDSNGITGVRTTTVHTYDLNNDERNWTLISAHEVRLESAYGNNAAGYLSSGPFTLAPGQEKQLLLAYIFALDSTELLAKVGVVRRFASSGFDDQVLKVHEGKTVVPVTFVLEQNYPNPFNPTTGIRFQVGQTLGPAGGRPGVSGVSDVKLTVYDLLGREVAVLVNERKAPGSYEVKFDGKGLASGVYLYRMQAGDFTETRRLCLIK
jgi:hypothetical protein